MAIADITAALTRPGFIYIPGFNATELLQLLEENIANPLSWTLLIRWDVSLVTHRIRRYVLDGDAMEAWRLKESYKEAFALEAVSAAIVAQIAITMPALPDFINIHWTATAFAYTSLASGLLSTFFSFYVQQALSHLHHPEDVSEWLTSPRNNLSDRVINAILHRPRSRRTAENEANRSRRIPSLTAAATLTAPSRLLLVSTTSLFVSLGIYLCSMCVSKLGTLRGSNANLAVLLFFITFSVWAISEVSLPLSINQIDQATASLRSEQGGDCQRRESGNNIRLTTVAVSSETSNAGNIIREALRVSIRAQEESLKAQKAFLGLLDSQPQFSVDIE